MKASLPTVLATSLIALATAAFAGPDNGQRAGTTLSGAKLPAAPLNLTPPNFFAPQWQRRLQGPTIDHTFDDVPLESVVVTPGTQNESNVQLAPVGLGSVWWAMMNPADAWRVLLPVQPEDQFETDRALALSYNDPQSDCPGFRGTPNIRPICP